MEDIRDDEDNWDWSDEAKDNYVNGRMEDVRDEPLQWLRDYGWDNPDSMERYILDSDGRGHGLASYDSNENEVMFDDEWYYIYRIN